MSAVRQIKINQINKLLKLTTMSNQVNEQTNAVATREKGKITYQVAGQDVTLSYQIVRDFLTKGNGQVTDQDLTQFISICKYNQLNPFLNEAYLVKFGAAPAQMIVSKEAFMKRAEACEGYQGIKAGVIVKRGEEVLELEGSFYLPTDVLLGGWSEVHREDKKFPFISKVTLTEYDKKQSLWNDKKATMIRKVAMVQALREAFPAQLGAMYTQEETNVQDVEYVDVTDELEKEKAQYANKQTIDIDALNAEGGTSQQAEETTPEVKAQAEQAVPQEAKPKAQPKANSNQQQPIAPGW